MGRSCGRASSLRGARLHDRSRQNLRRANRRDQMAVGHARFPDIGRSNRIEHHVLRELDPPLNLEGMPHTPTRSAPPVSEPNSHDRHPERWEPAHRRDRQHQSRIARLRSHGVRDAAILDRRTRGGAAFSFTPIWVTPACRPLRTRGSHATWADLVAASKDEQPPRGRGLRRYFSGKGVVSSRRIDVLATLATRTRPRPPLDFTKPLARNVAGGRARLAAAASQVTATGAADP